MSQELIPLELIDPNPWQTRLSEDPAHVDELAHDIKAIGMMQTPSARKVGERYQLAFGHNRLAAYKLLNTLGWESFDRFPLNIHELDDEQMAIAAFSENEKRQDLNPVEKAMAISKMINDFGWTQQTVAEKLHIDRSGVSNSLRMLRMPTRVLDCVAKGSMPVRSAISLLPIYDFTDDEVGTLYSRYSFDLAEFEGLAMNGEINSDAIRSTVEKYSNFLHPEQLQLIEVAPTVIESDVITATDENEPRVMEPAIPMATQAEITEWQVPEVAWQEGGEENETDIVGNNEQVDLPVESQRQTQAAEPAKPAVTEAETPAPAETQKPAPINEVDLAVDPNEIFVSIAWKTRGVVVSWKRPGMVTPKFKFLERLNFKEIPQMLEEIGL